MVSTIYFLSHLPLNYLKIFEICMKKVLQVPVSAEYIAIPTPLVSEGIIQQRR